MKKKNFTTFVATIIFSVGLLGFAKLTNKDPRLAVNGASTLQRVIDFEDLPAGNMSVTALNNKFYNGLIVADGKVTTTSKVIIDGNTMGMRMPANSYEDGITRKITIQVSGYTKIILDIKQERLYTTVSSGCGQSYSVPTNGTILRDIELPTYGYHEIILTFAPTSNIASTMDCGIDNIRFYGPGEGIPEPGDSSSETTPPESSSSAPSSGTSSTSSEANPHGYEVTIGDMAAFLSTKNSHYPISNAFIEEYQQTSGGYIAYAKQLGLLVDKTQHEPNQKWHFFDSWLQVLLDEGSISYDDDAKKRVYTNLLSPELLLWIYEACGVDNVKVQAAYDVAVEGKIAGTHSATLAKNMRACVSWDDVKADVIIFKNNQ